MRWYAGQRRVCVAPTPLKAMSTTPWTDWIAAYERHAQLRQRQPRGIASYLKVLHQLHRYAGDRALSPAIIAEYLGGRRVSAATMNYEITVIGQWGAFLRRRGWIDVDLVGLVDRPRRRRPPPIEAPMGDVAVLARWIEHGEGHHRDRRLAGLCLYGGLRISEASATLWSAVDLAAGELKVLSGKGGHYRLVPIAPPLRRLLEAVPADQRVGAVAGRSDGAPLSHKSGAHVFERVIPRVVGVTISPHMLRRAFATRLDDLGVSIRVIQDLLGHVDLDTTARYINPDRRRKRDATDSLDGAF